ncbi:MAG: hypothetical protein MZV64_33770 [Ignavibacteriales bacterium]|nr:hypothetical protein [Ignavibacteriales bacterium]
MFEASAGKKPARPAQVPGRPGLHGLVRQRPAWAGRRPSRSRWPGSRQRLGLTIGPFVVYGRLRQRDLRPPGQGRPARRSPAKLRGRRRDGQADRLPAGPGRPRPLRPAPRLGLPDGQRRRQPQARAPEICRAGRARHRPRAAQPEGPPRPVPDQDAPGLRRSAKAVDSPSVQDPRRHVPPADHRGEHHPQHRRLLGRDRRLPHRRQRRAARSRRTGEMNYRNIFKHIHGKGYTGRPLHGARPEPQAASTANGPSSTAYRGAATHF